jgi:hypothetical protein
MFASVSRRSVASIFTAKHRPRVEKQATYYRENGGNPANVKIIQLYSMFSLCSYPEDGCNMFL